MERIQLQPTDLPLPMGQAHHRDLLRHMGQVHRVDPPPAVRLLRQGRLPHTQLRRVVLLQRMKQQHRVDLHRRIRRLHRVQQLHRTDLPRHTRHGRLRL